MEFDNLMKLIDKVSESPLANFTLEEGCFKLNIEKKDSVAEDVRRERIIRQYIDKTEAVSSEVSPAARESLVQTAEDSRDKEEYIFIVSPIVGTFYHASGPEAKPFVAVGDRICKGQVVGIIEAMKLMNEIQSDVEGIVAEIVAGNEQGVAYGEPLIKLVKA